MFTWLIEIIHNVGLIHVLWVNQYYLNYLQI